MPVITPHLKVMECSDTGTSIVLRHRTLPAVLSGLFCVGFIAFGGYVVWNLRDMLTSGGGSWLPPFDRLPQGAKQMIIFTCIGLSLLICLVPVVHGLRVLLWGDSWEVDLQQRALTHSGKHIRALDELSGLVIEGDFQDDIPTLTLYFTARDGKKIRAVSGALNETQFQSFIEAARLIEKRTNIGWRKTGIAPVGFGWNFPDWWNALG